MTPSAGSGDSDLDRIPAALVRHGVQFVVIRLCGLVGHGVRFV